MGLPIHKLGRTALRILIAWLLAFQPMVAAHAAASMAGQAPLSMELCRSAGLDRKASDQGIPSGTDHSSECCLSAVPVPAPPPEAALEVSEPSIFFETLAQLSDSVFVATAGLGPQSARAPPL
ncbi:hypothetical protein IZ6_31100 [Terrihabitans soli]|uniref:DUF2946 domain-containing protein n=1 Tax=Terrihabitans soli TaxID=708113 RepID=A0A6S6QXX3_9HYPH|nr:DUF2946 family protein [Terrihabitans soli]BCJ92375.1 hypothetical protein IZ6_31100 [Terrihabitans soli]